MKTPRSLASQFALVVLALAWAIPSALFGQIYNSCDQWGNITTGGYTIYNNIWGGGAGSQCLTVNSPGNWFVDANHPATGGIKSYPNVERKLSQNVDTMGSVTSLFAVTRPGGGSYSSTYDIWYNNYAYEVMLWMNHTGAVGPIASRWDANGSPIADATNVSVGGHTWNVYRGSNGSNAVFSFVRTSGTNSGTVDITAISKWLRNAGWFGNVNLHSVQFGFEITSSGGNQRYSVTNFSVNTGEAAALAVSATSRTYGAEASTQSVSLTSNVSWTASDNQSWITVSPASGSNNGTLNIAVAQNTGTASRSGTVTVNGGGLSRTIAVTQAGAAITPPAIPSGVAAKAGNGNASVTWNAVGGATGYVVKRATTSGGPYTNVATVSYTTNFLDSGLSNGTTYYYVVAASNAGGTSANSSQVGAVPSATASVTLQAENSALGGGTAVSTNTAGYHGTGYANYPATGGTTTFNSVNGGSGGSAQLVFRFGLVGTATRTGTITINGTSQNISFPPTVEWTNWSTMAFNVTLTAGATNTIVIASTGEDLASIDEVTVIPTGGVEGGAPVLTGLLAYDGFAYTSGGSIAGQGGGFGWGANWSSTGNPQDVSTAQAASLASGNLLAFGGSAKLGPSSVGGSTSSGVYMRQFANTLGSLAAGGNGTVWLSLLYLNSTSGADASGYYGESRIGLYSGVTATSGVTQTSGATNVLNTGTPTTSASVFDRVSLYLGSTVNATGVATPRSTTPAHLLLKIVADNTTATDTVYLWVNPNLAAGESANNTAHATWTTADVSGVNGLRFQQTGSNGGVVATIDEIRLGRTFGDVTASSALPSPWATADVGSVAAVGNAGHSAGVFTVTGSGSGIAGTADEFRSVHQSGSGDCAIVARVTSLSATSANAKAGVSIRESAASNAIQASCLVANGSVSFVYRTSTGSATTTVPVSGVNPPRWVKIERVGNVFAASHSADGLTWSAVGSATNPMASTTTLGTVVTSEADGTLATGTIDQVTATP